MNSSKCNDIQLKILKTQGVVNNKRHVCLENVPQSPVDIPIRNDYKYLPLTQTEKLFIKPFCCLIVRVLSMKYKP